MAADEVKEKDISSSAEEKVENSNTSTSGAATNKTATPKKGEDVSLRYRGLSFDMAVELQLYEEEYFFWDKPVPFGEKLMLYPVNVKDYNHFMDAVSCFLLDKKTLPPNVKPDVIKKQLKMTDLEFMLSKMESNEWVLRFSKLIELVMHVKNGMRCPVCGEIMSYGEYKEAAMKIVHELLNKEAKKTEEKEEEKEEISENSEKSEKSENEEENKDEVVESGKEGETPVVKCPHCGGDGLYETIRYEENEQTHKLELFIDGQKIDFKDFNRLRNIVLFQNLPDYRDTSYIDPNLKKDYETKKRIQGQKNANLTATLEKKLAAMKIFMGLPNYDGLYNMSVRRFLIEFSTMDDYISYNLQMMGRLCGLGGGGKDAPEHWIYKEVKDVYADGGYISK
ncbi:MAG: hypothetical protein J6T10_00600, partial [Methanobrevibacter sp.]|nr:hypothetical protein [Methanobrevibacter sp.]